MDEIKTEGPKFTLPDWPFPLPPKRNNSVMVLSCTAIVVSLFVIIWNLLYF